MTDWPADELLLHYAASTRRLFNLDAWINQDAILDIVSTGRAYERQLDGHPVARRCAALLLAIVNSRASIYTQPTNEPTLWHPTDHYIDAVWSFGLVAVRSEIRYEGYQFSLDKSQHLCATALSVIDGNLPLSVMVDTFAEILEPQSFEDRLHALSKPILEYSGIRAYVVSKLTGLGTEEHKEVERMSRDIKRVLGQLGATVHLPIDNSDPATEMDLPDYKVHDLDYLTVLESDIVICIVDYPTTGGGKEIAWAERNLTPVLLLSHSFQVSRLLTGSSSVVEDEYWNESDGCRVPIARFLERLAPRIRRHALDRLMRERELDNITTRIRRAIQIAEQLQSNGNEGLLAQRRLREIGVSAATVDNATIAELRHLAKAAGLPLAEILGAEVGSLDPEELFFLEQASAGNGWAVGKTVKMALAAAGTVASVGHRESLRSVEGWEEFDNGSFD